ncbi:MAG TPA: hypothetical protein QGF58_14550 [Myxococcota bacterium]|nr:hypothetical protein [Myxococcota bacterium]
MASQVFELMLAQDVPANFIQPMEGVVDAGAYRQLNVDFNLIRAGTGGTLELEHSATLREEGFFKPQASARMTSSLPGEPPTVQGPLGRPPCAGPTVGAHLGVPKRSARRSTQRRPARGYRALEETT